MSKYFSLIILTLVILGASISIQASGTKIADQEISVSNEDSRQYHIIRELRQNGIYRTVIHTLDNSSSPVNVKISGGTDEVVNITGSPGFLTNQNGLFPISGNLSIGETVTITSKVDTCVGDAPVAQGAKFTTIQPNTTSYVHYQIIIDQKGEDQCGGMVPSHSFLLVDVIYVIMTISILSYWVRSYEQDRRVP